MKRIASVLSIVFLLLLSACQSAEATELLAYHNDHVTHINTPMLTVDEVYGQIWEVEEDEALKLIEEDLEPLLKKMSTYLAEQILETEEAQTYHLLRKKAYTSFYEAMQIEIAIYRGLLDGTMSEEEVEAQFAQSSLKLAEASEQSAVADEKMKSYAQQYKFEEVN